MPPLPPGNQICIVRRLMRTRFVVRPSLERILRGTFAALMLLAMVVSASGCDELDARQKVQEGNKEYKNGRYEKARDLYEGALAKSPDLAIAHHNLGVTYYRLVKTGDDSAENRDVANKAAEHLQAYLKTTSDKKDHILIPKLLTEVWVNSDQVDRALDFWKAEHDARPEDNSVLEQLADLNYKKGDWRTAVKWLEQSVEIAKTPDTKASAYSQIGTLAFLRLLNNKDLPGQERIELADRGIGALQRGLELQPKNMQIISTLASLNQQRAIASTSRLGYHIDLAMQQNYMRQFVVLREEAKQKAAEEAAAGNGGGE